MTSFGDCLDFTWRFYCSVYNGKCPIVCHRGNGRAFYKVQLGNSKCSRDYDDFWPMDVNVSLLRFRVNKEIIFFQ